MLSQVLDFAYCGFQKEMTQIKFFLDLSAHWGKDNVKIFLIRRSEPSSGEQKGSSLYAEEDLASSLVSRHVVHLVTVHFLSLFLLCNKEKR